MSTAPDIITRFFEVRPYPPDQERLIRTVLRLVDDALERVGIPERTRVVVVRDVLWGSEPEEEWRPPGNGSGWTGPIPVVR